MAGRRRDTTKEQDALARAGADAPSPAEADGGAPRTADLVYDPVSGFESKYMRRRGAEAAKELLEELDPENRELMQALFIDEVGLEAYAKRIGKHASTVMRRRDRSLPMLYARINAMRRRG